MKLKTKKEEKFLMCAGCGRTFLANMDSAESLMEHQKNNTECNGFFTIDVLNK